MVERVRDILKEKYDIATAVEHDVIIGDNGLIKVQIEPPCTNQNCREDQKKWLLRMAPSEPFDRWSVSAAICERFETPQKLVEYLCYTRSIYVKLFARLSKDYKELYERWEELAFEGFEKCQ